MPNSKICRRSFLFLGGASPLKVLIYDAKNPAPVALKQDWMRFQKGDRPKISGV